MQRWGAVLVAAAFIAECASSQAADNGDEFPIVTIVGVRVADGNATLTYRAFDAGNDLAITIDWGDGSALQGFTGQGDQTATHLYTGDVTAATVTVTGTDTDGNVASDSASVDLLGAVTSPSVETSPSTEPRTSTTTTASTSTTTPPAPTPTTTTATTTSTTTTSTTTTTT